MLTNCRRLNSFSLRFYSLSNPFSTTLIFTATAAVSCLLLTNKVGAEKNKETLLYNQAYPTSYFSSSPPPHRSKLDLDIESAHRILSNPMSWQSVGKSNEDLIEQLWGHKLIEDNTIKDAMKATDRAWYCARPSGRKAPLSQQPYHDSPQSIGWGATISAPHMHAMCLELLKNHLKPGMRALDVGSGSGYLAACMARMVGKEGKVVGIEHIDELVDFSKKNIEEDDKKLFEIIEIRSGDGRLGADDHAPYDAIHVGAAADKIPAALIQQLKPGGRLVIPVGPQYSDQYLELIEKAADGQSYERKVVTGVRYVPLTDKQEQYDNHT